MEEKEYKIEIGMQPHPWDNSEQPFWWCLLCYHTDWCNKGFGWAETPEEAWQEAYKYYMNL